MSVQANGDGGADAALVFEQRVLDLCHDELPKRGTGTEVAYDLIANELLLDGERAAEPRDVRDDPDAEVKNYTVFDVSARLREQGWLVPAYTFPQKPREPRGAEGGRPGRDVPRHGRPLF